MDAAACRHSAQIGDGFYEAMSLAVLRTYLGNAPIKLDTTVVDSDGQSLGWIHFVRIGDTVRIPLDDRMAALVPYRSQGGFRYVSASDVLRGTLGVEELKDRIVIVGTSARGLVDVRATPTREDLPGVEIHASLIAGALDNAVKSRPTEMLAIATLTILLVGVPSASVRCELPTDCRRRRLRSWWSACVQSSKSSASNAWAWQAHKFSSARLARWIMLIGLYFVDVAWGYSAETHTTGS